LASAGQERGGTFAPDIGTTPAEARGFEARIESVLGQFAVMQLVLACSGVVRNKVVALRLGPAAFGEVSQIAALMAVAGSLVSFGMAVSLSRNAARATALGERQGLLSNANGIVLGLSAAAVASGVTLLFTGRLLPLAGLSHTGTAAVACLIFIAAVPLEGVKHNFLALLQGIMDVRGLAFGRSAAVLLATVLSVPVVWFLGVPGAAIQFFMLSAFAALLLGWRCHALGYAPAAVRLDRTLVARLATFGMVSLASAFAQNLADAAVRTSLIEKAGAAANGLLQAPYVLSITVRGVLLASIGSFSLAAIGPRTDRKEVSAVVNGMLGAVLPIGVLALGLLGLLGSRALTLLYSSAFAPAASLFPFILSADLLVAAAWVVGAPLLAFGDKAIWLALDLLFAALRLVLAVALVDRLGSTAVVLGYLGAAGVHLVLNLAVYRFRYRMAVEARNLFAIGGGAALVAAFSWAGTRAGLAPAPILPLSISVWTAMAVLHARRIGMLRAVITRFTRR